MQINKKKLAKSELIGLNVKVIRSDNHASKGIQGKVVDETKSMLFVEEGKKTKRIIKNQCVFEFTINNQKIIIQGKSIAKRPEERIKQR
jgi:ribonuclease P protein subunit POP4